MKTYPSKILLFGEHTVNLGTNALAMPLPAYRSRWVPTHLPKEKLQHEQRQLPELAIWLERQAGSLPFELDIEQFRQALSQGWVLESNIPEGYGLGSSGAVVAAIVDRWGAGLPTNLAVLRTGLAAIEAFFHGKSSGIDPLVSFLGQPVCISAKNINTIKLPSLNNSGLFILDTGMRRSATPLIRRFLDAWSNPEFEKLCTMQLLPSVNEAIENTMNGNWTNLFASFERISHFQLQYTPWLIPSGFHAVWEQLLREQKAALKICGAGGGGFLLGMVCQGASLPEAVQKWPIKFLEELSCS